MTFILSQLYGIVERIKKALGLNGEDKANKYYRVADVISDLMHFCDHYPYFKPDDDNITFDSEYQKGIEFYHEEKEKYGR